MKTREKTLFFILIIIPLFIVFLVFPRGQYYAQGAGDDWKANYDAEIAKLAKAAKKEGKVVIYAGTEPQPYMDAVRDYFDKNYSISVEFVKLRAMELWARIRAEAAAGKMMGDYHMSGSPVNRGVAMEGNYEYYIPPIVKEPSVTWHIDPLLDKEKKVYKGKAFPIAVYPDPNGVVINTRLIPAEKIPKTFEDFLDPFFKGKLAFHDPRVPGPGNLFFMYMDKLYGAGYLNKFKEQNVTIERSYPIGIRATASGEYLMYIGVAARMVKGMEDAPIKLIYPEGVVPSITMIGILKGSPHPNAARLYVNFALSKAGQEIAAKYGDRTPIRGDVTEVAKDANLTGRKILPLFSFEEDTIGKRNAREKAKLLLSK
jgi:iron(III) transport system substrate-binding protein